MSAPPRAGAALETCVARSFAALDMAAWDSLAGGDLYASSRWLRAVEPIFAPYSAFVLVRDGGRRGRPVAGVAAYLVTDERAYLFLNPPRLVVSDPLHAALAERPEAERRRARELVAGLAPKLARRYPVAVCVSPFTPAGGVVGAAARPEVARRLLDGFMEVAASWAARSTAFLSLREGSHAALTATLRSGGHVPSQLGARCSLPIRWRSFDHYLASLWRKRRWKVRSELRAFEASGFRARVVYGTRLREVTGDLAPLFANLQRKYGHGGDVAAARETIEWVGEHLAPLARVVLIEDGSRPVAFHLLYELHGTLYSYLAGQVYEQRVQDAAAFFQAVYYQPIELAIRRRLARIDFSSESYEAKLWRGCELSRTVGLFDFGADLRGELAALLTLVDAGQRARFERYARYRQLRH